MNRYPSYETEEGQDIILCLTSNEKHSAHLFCGHHSGCATMMDVEAQQIVREFNPHGDDWKGDAVGEIDLYKVDLFAGDRRVASPVGCRNEIWENPSVRCPRSCSVCQFECP